jgi:hypothetical protein
MIRTVDCLTDLYDSNSHVGCSDSSKGTLPTKHFVNTSHPLFVALPDRWVEME